VIKEHLEHALAKARSIVQPVTATETARERVAGRQREWHYPSADAVKAAAAAACIEAGISAYVSAFNVEEVADRSFRLVADWRLVHLESEQARDVRCSLVFDGANMPSVALAGVAALHLVERHFWLTTLQIRVIEPPADDEMPAWAPRQVRVPVPPAEDAAVAADVVAVEAEIMPVRVPATHEHRQRLLTKFAAIHALGCSIEWKVWAGRVLGEPLTEPLAETAAAALEVELDAALAVAEKARAAVEGSRAS